MVKQIASECKILVSAYSCHPRGPVYIYTNRKQIQDKKYFFLVGGIVGKS